MMNSDTPSRLTMYGIKNCDTIRKARRFLEDQGVEYHFHDYRSDGLDSTLLHTFIDTLGYQTLLNTRGTTWRKLPEETRAAVTDNQSALQVMLENPAVIKRPLLCAANNAMLTGFDPAAYQTFIQENL